MAKNSTALCDNAIVYLRSHNHGTSLYKDKDPIQVMGGIESHNIPQNLNSLPYSDYITHKTEVIL